MGKIIEIDYTVNIAEEIIKKNKDIKWLSALEIAKELASKSRDEDIELDIDCGVVYNKATGEVIADLWQKIGQVIKSKEKHITKRLWQEISNV